VPTYDYRCAEGHVTERRVASYDADSLQCSCGLLAQRIPAYVSTGINGVAIPPMSARKIPMIDAFNAIEEVQSKARKDGVEPPDLLAAGQRRAEYIQKHAPELVEGT